MRKIFLLILGWLSVMLGILGVFLPLLPTTPFLLLASFLFYKSSPKAREWLLQHRLLGVYIRNYQIYKAIPLRAKIYTSVLLWGTMILSIVLISDKLWLVLLLLAIAVGVSYHIWSFKTLEEGK